MKTSQTLVRHPGTTIDTLVVGSSDSANGQQNTRAGSSTFMAPLPPRRRVSDGIPVPPSAVPVPCLWLPPLGYDRQGSVNPIVIPNSAQHPEPTPYPPSENEARHRLGVSALAFDTTTQLAAPFPPRVFSTMAHAMVSS